MDMNEHPGIRQRLGLSPMMWRAVMIWVGLSIIMIIASVTIPRGLSGLPPLASREGRDAALTLEVFTILACPVWSMVIVFMFMALFNGRIRGRRIDSAVEHDGPPLRASRNLQIAWVAGSTLLVFGLFAWGLIFLDRADAAPGPGANVLYVYVTGEQWNWDFTYPQYGYAQSETLEVPDHRPILFVITSLDVVHSFSVPAWGIKQDAVPGDWTYIRATPSQVGAFSVRCYELCGMFHAYMEEPVRVVSTDAFTTWVGRQHQGYPWGMYGVSAPNNYTAPTFPGAPTPVPPNLGG